MSLLSIQAGRRQTTTTAIAIACEAQAMDLAEQPVPLRDDDHNTELMPPRPPIIRRFGMGLSNSAAWC
jgi:hypothetical protein